MRLEPQEKARGKPGIKSETAFFFFYWCDKFGKQLLCITVEKI